MFNPRRWAAAFVNSQGAGAAEGFECLKVLVPWVKTLPGAVFGSAAARQVEALGGAAVAKTGSSSPIPEGALHFTALLVKKNFFRCVDSVMVEIEKILNRRQGIVPATVQSAFPLEGDFEARLCEEVKKRTGAREVRLEKKIDPELIGGYRLYIGDEIIDASVRVQLQNMAAVLADGGN